MSGRRNISGSAPAGNVPPVADALPEHMLKTGGYMLRQQDAARLRVALTDCDTIVSSNCGQIVALAVAAQRMLAMDALALERVHALLDVVHLTAESMCDSVDSIASDHDASAADARNNEFSRRIWAESRALRGTVQEGGAA